MESMDSNTQNGPDFSIDLAKVKALGIANPLSQQALQLYDQNGLSAAERLLFCIWHNNTLESRAFKTGDSIAHSGDRALDAYIVVSGEMHASDGKNSYVLGPGSVIGLAEGLADLPYHFTVIANTTVTARLIPVDKARRELLRINAGLRGICRSAIVRTLGLSQIPESLQ